MKISKTKLILLSAILGVASAATTYAYPVWVHLDNHTNNTIRSVVDTSRSVCMGDVNSRLQDLTVGAGQTIWYDPNVETSFSYDRGIDCGLAMSVWSMQFFNVDKNMQLVGDVTCRAYDGSLQECWVNNVQNVHINLQQETHLQWKIELTE